MLSLKEGNPIAIIIGGKYDNKILRIKKIDENNNNENLTDLIEFIDENKLKKSKKYMNSFELKNMFEDYLKNEDNLKNLKNISYKDFKIYDGKLSPYPSIFKKEDQRDVYYIGGPSGSGKSYLTAQYLKNYKKVFPTNNIYLFSRVENDEVLDKIKGLKRIILNDEILENPIDIKELSNSCCIFDDIDTIPNSKLRKNIQELRDDILQVGRHELIYCICTSHVLTNYGSTRLCLSESSHIGFFPKCGSSYHIIRMLKIYCGLSQSQIKKIMDLPSRWVIIGRKYPQYVLYDTGCYLLSNDK